MGTCCEELHLFCFAAEIFRCCTSGYHTWYPQYRTTMPSAASAPSSAARGSSTSPNHTGTCAQTLSVESACGLKVSCSNDRRDADDVPQQQAHQTVLTFRPAQALRSSPTQGRSIFKAEQEGRPVGPSLNQSGSLFKAEREGGWQGQACRKRTGGTCWWQILSCMSGLQGQKCVDSPGQ